MKNKLLEWLESNQKKEIDFNNSRNRLTICPKADFVRIKYWEPKQIKETEKYFWWSISEIIIYHAFLEDHTNYHSLAEFLYQKLLEGGHHEISN